MNTLTIRGKKYFPTTEQWKEIEAAQAVADRQHEEAIRLEEESGTVFKPRPLVKILTEYWERVFVIMELEDIEPIVIKP